ncbi:hypothetical protein PPTG_20867 [Phytophthora nicotianae INRA-310]|uniref:Crinkler effector protein N-terminal domain-containing protein n=2 Tax=Phytophthora nicotianae TaxID=4792 RepID=W2RIL1_PHYN3|nr:hypothetical protein PPTG_20867 [Phytophthora nicotianae INRA-310]ETI40681.1 hypothetical protein F443_13993 [Phytophthora nicotianae P1569]ETN25071.1 hypothetical protein PPTG_20867 [Phytophthora nicotianae INRA-310]
MLNEDGTVADKVNIHVGDSKVIQERWSSSPARLTRNGLSVRVEESASVNSLKKAIQAEKLTITCDANEMQLFLAKKGGAWLTEAYVNDGVSDTNDLKPSQHRHDWRR